MVSKICLTLLFVLFCYRLPGHRPNAAASGARWSIQAKQ